MELLYDRGRVELVTMVSPRQWWDKAWWKAVGDGVGWEGEMEKRDEWETYLIRIYPIKIDRFSARSDFKVDPGTEPRGPVFKIENHEPDRLVLGPGTGLNRPGPIWFLSN